MNMSALRKASRERGSTANRDDSGRGYQLVASQACGRGRRRRPLIVAMHRERHRPVKG